MAEKIIINNLKIPARHGVYSSEKDVDGLFEINIVLWVNLEKAIKTDRIINTVDYSAVISIVNDVFTKKDYNLIETVASKICNKMLQVFPVIKQVKINIKKPHAPISANFDSVEVEIKKRREKI